MIEIKGIDLKKVTGWLDANMSEFPAPYQFDLVAAGGSNLTYIVKAGNGERFVLRRPPLRARLATAHDMQREYRIMSALRNSAVPVPAMLAYCDDKSVNGAVFYCMEMIDGIVIRDQSDTVGMSRQQCRAATESLIASQVAFHQVDLDAIGLSDLSRHDDYTLRQLKRWRKQVEASKTRELPLFDRIHEELVKSVPDAVAKPGLAHGDYRFDNTILNENYKVQVVLDWELCTIGDPISDFIWSLNYWAEPEETLHWLLDPPTKNSMFPRRKDVMNLYTECSGFSVSNIEWYTVFSWWKQACIVEGVYSRMQKGATGGMKIDSLDLVGKRVEQYLEYAQSIM